MIGAKAPAKLNLFFEVGKKRPDGYHDVLSLYQALDLFEEVYVEPSDNWQITVTGDLPEAELDLVPRDESNLVVKAAKAIALKAGITNPQPMHFKIVKKVPAAGGVAGGSADAAAALVALNEAWCLGLTPAQLSEVGAGLGADVPFALLGGTAIGVDSGIELTSIPPLPMTNVLLVFSNPGISTKESFRVFDELFPEGDIHQEADELKSFDLGLAGRNSLLEPALKLRPDLSALMGLVPGAKLSGSGPTIYFVAAGDLSETQEVYAAKGLKTLETRFSPLGAELI